MIAPLSCKKNFSTVVVESHVLAIFDLLPRNVYKKKVTKQS